ncbi:MAG TPA: hypothetical protein VF266_07515 [Thermoanaerobaculia bacterium]
MKKILTMLLAAMMMLTLAACDTPKENATEERIEDAGEKAGQSEDAAEQHGEAVKDGTATDTTGTMGTTSTTATVTETSATTATSGT